MRQRDTLHQTVCHLYQEPEMCKLAAKLLHLMCIYHSTVGFKSQIQVTQSGWDSSLSTSLPRTFLDLDPQFCYVCYFYVCDCNLHGRAMLMWWKEIQLSHY